MDGDFVVRLVLGLAVIGIGLASLRWTLPLLTRNRPALADRRIQVVDSTVLSANTAIHLVRVEGRLLLLGGGGGHVRVLAELADGSNGTAAMGAPAYNGVRPEAQNPITS